MSLSPLSGNDHVTTQSETERRYAEERDKRKAARGTKEQDYTRLEQIIDPDKQDPHKKVEPREPVFDDVEVTIIGGGWAGLMTGAEFKKAGRDVRILDKAGDFGGVWYWNRYPGLMCDTASVVYLPLLEETGYKPTEFYAHGPEIRHHAQRIGEHFDLYDGALFHTRVTELKWLEDKKRWQVSTNRGDKFTTQFISMGIGALSTPRMPSFEGVSDFKGDWFHTARWDYSITGGTPEGEPMDKLKDKKVAIIGTGATALQAVPELGKTAKELYVIQRTPTAVAERNNGPLHYDWWDELTSKEGWQDVLYENFLDHAEEWKFGKLPSKDNPNLLDDGWTQMGELAVNELSKIDGEITPEAYKQAMYNNDDRIQAEIRDRVDELVKDPDVAENLKAWYHRWCKRPGFHDEYLQSFNQDNVHLVDTEGKGVEKITENGVVVAGREYEVDLIVYGTGFQYLRNAAKDADFSIIGRDGEKLIDKWNDGMLSYLGYFTHDFPNLFFQQSVQASFLTSNVSQNYRWGAKAVRDVVEHALKNGYDTFEADQKAEDDWVHYLETEGNVADDPDCTPGYYNNEGNEIGIEQKRSVGDPRGQKAFFNMIEEWRKDGEFKGLNFA